MTEKSRKHSGNAVLCLAFDGTRLEGVVLRRCNGSAEVAGSVSYELTVNLLSHEPELAGQEIRDQLAKAGIRERQCVVAVPQGWAMLMTTQLPSLEGDDLTGFVQMEAERGFSAGADSLTLSVSRHPEPLGSASIIGIPNDSLLRLDAALRAARLVPISFTLGVPMLQQLTAGDSETSLSLLIGRQGVGLAIGQGTGVMSLRSLDPSQDPKATDSPINSQILIRELRITLGQLSPAVRQALRTIRVFGEGPAADRVASDLLVPARSLGLHVERLAKLPSEKLGFRLPEGCATTPQMALAAAMLAGRSCGLEFLPPRITAWQRFTSKYASRSLAYAAVLLGVGALTVAGMFGFQQVELSRLGTEWKRLSGQVRELEELQGNIKTYRAWYDESYRHMTILRKLTEAFPEEGSVTAKTVEIRDGGLVTCTGTARDVQSLYRAIDALRAAREVTEVQLDQLRVKAPLQFSFNFHYGEKTQP